MPLEDFDQPGEITEAAGQPVNLVHDHDVDLAGLDVGHQPLEAGPIHIAAGEAWIDVVVGHRNPALGALAGDVGQSGILLRIEGIEGLVETLVTGDAAIDGAAFGGDDTHFRPPFTPKNAGPDQWVPVIARAAADRLL